MKKKCGFTLTELMVVIFIVAIMAVIMVPIIQGRIDSAKWSEGKAYMGIISNALRAHIMETCENYSSVPTLEELGFIAEDFDGRYFSGGESGEGDFSWIINDNDPPDFLITATAPDEIQSPSQITLDNAGQFTETP